ncbi:unnamed protein product, partial [Effrenium voratum]
MGETGGLLTTTWNAEELRRLAAQPRLAVARISALGRQSWQAGLSFLRALHGQSLERHLYSYSAALKGLESGQWQQALGLLDELLRLELEPDSMAFHAAMRACKDEWTQAISLLDLFRARRLRASALTFTACAKAVSATRAWRAAVALAQEAVDMGQMDTILLSSVLSSVPGEAWTLALQLLNTRRVALDAGAYVSVMSVCEKASQWTAALDLLSALLRAALQPEGAAYSSAISSCGKAEQWERALQLPRGDAAAAAAAVLALERGSQWQAALGLFLNMRSQERSELGYLAAFGACEKGTRWRMGPQLLSAMQQQLLRPAAVASTAAVAAVAEEWPQAVLLLAGMRRRAVCDASPAFNAALGGLAGLTEWQLALAMLWRKQQLSLPMKGMNFGAAVSAANGARQWRQGAKLLASAWEVWGGLSAEDATESGGVWEGVEILAKGPGLVAINKPSGVSTEAVLAKLPVAAVSRLDKPTSGVLVAALGSDCSPAFQLASAQFSARSVVKEYLCLCHGSLGAPGAQGRTARPLLRDWASGRMAGDGGGGAAAATAFEVLEVFGGPGALTLLKVTPETGRRHQIRVHLASLGRPIVSDPLYGSEDPWCPQLFLHCRRTVLLDAAGGA